MNTQNTLISYHKIKIVPEWLSLTVYLKSCVSDQLFFTNYNTRGLVQFLEKHRKHNGWFEKMRLALNLVAKKYTILSFHYQTCSKELDQDHVMWVKYQLDWVTIVYFCASLILWITLYWCKIFYSVSNFIVICHQQAFIRYSWVRKYNATFQ